MTDDPKKPDRKGKKPLSPHYKGNNTGGYGNAPVKSQFKKGCKPGPGRPKGSKTLGSEMRKMFKGKVSRSDGQAIPMMEAMSAAARKVILTGGARGIELGMRLAEQFGPQEPEENQPDFSVLNEVELALMSSFMLRAFGAPPAPPEKPENAGPLYNAPPPVTGPCMVSLGEDGHLKIEKIDPSSTPLLPNFTDPDDPWL